MDSGGGRGQHRGAALPQRYRPGPGEQEGPPFRSGGLKGYVRRSADRRFPGGGVNGQAGEVPARRLHIPQVHDGGLKRGSVRRGRLALRFSGGVFQSGLRSGAGGLDRRQQAHHQLQVHPFQPRQEGQHGSAFQESGGVPAVQQHSRQEILHPRGGAAGELSL